MLDAGRLTLKAKSGTLVPAQFTGSPKVASVTFGTPYGASYSVVVDIETTGNRSFVHSVKNVTPAGFLISLCADSISGLVSVSWQTVVEGEE